MLKSVRIQAIKEMIIQQGEVSVSTLSSQLGVSKVTIRNDLEYLESEKIIKRTHGGAMLNLENKMPVKTPSFTVELPADSQVEADKQRVAKLAVSLIVDDEWVFLGQGTTCCYMAKELVSREKLNVITNNLKVAMILTENTNANVVLTGGNLVHQHSYLSGEIFKKCMDNVFVSRAFMGVAGVDLKAGYTVSGMAEVSVNKQVKKISQKYYYVFDKSKLGVISFMSCGELDMADAVITNSDIGESYRRYYEEHEIPIFQV